MKNVNEELKRMIEASPKSFGAKCFTCPLSVKDDVNEKDFPGYDFYYSKYIEEETMYLAERFYKDEDLFMNHL